MFRAFCLWRLILLPVSLARQLSVLCHAEATSILSQNAFLSKPDFRYSTANQSLCYMPAAQTWKLGRVGPHDLKSELFAPYYFMTLKFAAMWLVETWSHVMQQIQLSNGSMTSVRITCARAWAEVMWFIYLNATNFHIPLWAHIFIFSPPEVTE